jgi:hypothetical protein
MNINVDGLAQPSPNIELGVRNAHAIVYDSHRERVLLFGGADESKVCNDAWEWDGKHWTRATSLGPEPRTFPSMAYDSHRHKIVLFGGNRVLFGTSVEDNWYLQDIWEWDGLQWMQRHVIGPPPRAEAAIAYDKHRGRVVLFGGYNRANGTLNRLGDTWEWDGLQWTELLVTGPSPRNGAVQVYDSVRGKIVLFGGSTDQGVSGETWEWDGQSWVENRAARTEGRFNCAMAFDDARHRVIRFGGRYAGKPVGDTWEYDGRAWSRSSTIGPTPRNHTAMGWDAGRKRAVLFGGHDFGLDEEQVFVYGDTWEWNGMEWQLVADAGAKTRVENGH